MNVPKLSLDIKHYPVMIKEVIKTCELKEGEVIVDCTFGGGGYSKELLKFPNINVIALDRDNNAEQIAKKIKKNYYDRFTFFNEKFSNLEKAIGNNKKVDTIIFDLGVSSFQLMDMSRGFSFNSKEKLDMTMGLASTSAEEVINNYDEKNLKLIIKIFGDENEASRIVKNIIKARKIKKITKVQELVEIIKRSKKKNYLKKINVCTKTFQALRIFVNKETTELVEGIIKATQFVKSGGKIIVISFHSIEDKIIKFYFSNYSKSKPNPSRYLPEKKSDDIIFFENYNNKLLKPSIEEVNKNFSSRSAKLRHVTRSNGKFEEPTEFKTKFKKYLDLEDVDV